MADNSRGTKQMSPPIEAIMRDLVVRDGATTSDGLVVRFNIAAPFVKRTSEPTRILDAGLC